MAPHTVTFLLALASQNGDVPANVAPEVWPYYVAIGALSTAVATMFGVILKQNSSHSDAIAKIHEEHRKAIEERSRRFSDEFKEKDQKLYDVSVKMAGIVEQVTSAINGLTEQIKELPK